MHCKSNPREKKSNSKATDILVLLSGVILSCFQHNQRDETPNNPKTSIAKTARLNDSKNRRIIPNPTWAVNQLIRTEKIVVGFLE